MGRQRKSARRNRIRHEKTNTFDLHLAHLPLPFGTCINLNTHKRILLYADDQNLDAQWQQTRRQVNEIDSDMEIFDNLGECIDYIKKECVKKLYLLVLNGNSTVVVNIRQAVMNECPSEQLTDFYVSNGQQARIGDNEIIFHGAFDDHDSDKNNEDVSSDNFVPMAVYGLTHGQEISIRDLTKDQSCFIWFQLLIDTLLRLPRNQADMNDMLEVARIHYSSDSAELKKIDKFARDYRPTQAVWWYTNDSFIYRLLNRAFRTQDIRIIFTFRFFILDLYTQLANEARKIKRPPVEKTFRGQFLPVDELEMVRKSINGLISMNTFTSTTTDSSVAYIYAGYGSRLPLFASVVFEIDLRNDVENASFERPFAPIVALSSKRDEKEILLSMGTIFRIISVEECDDTWFIHLKLETQVKECLSELTAHLRKENMHPIVSELTLGDFLLDMGELHQAEQFYSIMLQQQILYNENEYEKALLYNSIGTLHITRGDYGASEVLFNQAYKLAKKCRSLMSTTLNNLGLAALNQGRYNRALTYFQRAEKYNQSSASYSSILSNIASVFIDKGQFKKARNYLHRALTIDQKALPSLHVGQAHLYDNLGVVEMNLGHYQESLDLFKKCLNIYQQSLPSNHHLIAHSLNHLGIVYSKLGDFNQAREYCEEALKIQLSSFEQIKDQHLLVAKSLNNLATLQFHQEDFSAAEESFQRVLQLKLAIQAFDTSLHPSLSTAYNNLGMVQIKLLHFDEALANFQQALDIELSIGNAADIAITYNNIGGVYHEKNNFIKAKCFYKKARSKALTVLPKTHPSIELYNDNLKKAKEALKENKANKLIQ